MNLNINELNILVLNLSGEVELQDKIKNEILRITKINNEPRKLSGFKEIDNPEMP